MIGGLGTMEIGIIAGIVILLFGAKKIPQLAKGVGEGIYNLRTGLKELEESEDGERKSTESTQDA